MRYDLLVSPRVKAARRLWFEARIARLSEWPDIAVKLEGKALRELKLARWIKQERIKAGVYGRIGSTQPQSASFGV